MLEGLIQLAKSEDLDQRVAHHQHDETADGDHEVPQLALNQHYDEAGIEESIKSGDLAHDKLDHMPSVETQNRLLLDTLLNAFDSPYFVTSSQQTLSTVQVVYPYSNASAALLIDVYRRQAKHGPKVYQCQDVHGVANTLHLVILNLFECL